VGRQELRSYKILLDCGPFAGGAAWADAEKAVLTLLPHVCAADPEGMSLIVFAESFMAAGQLRDKGQAAQALQDMKEVFADSASSALAEALTVAIDDSVGRPTSLLVVTPGRVTDDQAVASVIMASVKRMKTHFDLAISFLRIGADSVGNHFLQALANDVKAQCRWPIVDVMSLEGLAPGVAALEGAVNTSRGWGSEGGRRMSVWGTIPAEGSPNRRRSRVPSIADGVPIMRQPSYFGGEPAPRSSPTFGGDLSPGGAPPRVPSFTLEDYTFGSTPKTVSLTFFNSLAKQEQKEYLVLLDCSKGMGLAEYNVARHILARTLHSMYNLSHTGITMWVMQGARTFGTDNITDAKTLDGVFWQYKPDGATRFSSGLRQIFTNHFSRVEKAGGRKTALLVLVAGPPVDWYQSTDILVKAAVDDARLRQLTVSFLNVGEGQDFTHQMVEEVNTRASRGFADSYQVPSGDSASKLARNVPSVLAVDRDVVEEYVESYFPPEIVRGHFTIQPSKAFFRNAPL